MKTRDMQWGIRSLLSAVTTIVVLMSVPSAAFAHFIWATVEKGQVRFALLESPGDAPNAQFEKYVANLTPRCGDRTLSLGETKEGARYATLPVGQGFVTAESVVGARESEGKSYLLVYYAKGAVSLANAATLTKAPAELLAHKEGKELVVSLRQNGKAAPQTTVWVTQLLREAFGNDHDIVENTAFNRTLFAGKLTLAQLEVHLQQRALIHNEVHRILNAAAHKENIPYGAAQKHVLVLLFDDLIAMGSGWPTEAQARPLTHAFLQEIRDSEKQGPYFALGVQHVYYGGITNGGREIGQKIADTLHFLPTYYEKSDGYREYLPEVNKITDPAARQEMIRGGQEAYKYIIASSNEDIFKTIKIVDALVLLDVALPVRADEAAETLLKRAETATQAVQSLAADYTETYGTARSPSSGWSNTVKLLKPNFCRLDIRMAGPDKTTGVWKTTDSAIIVSDGKSRWQYGYRLNNYKTDPIDKRARGLNLVDIRPLIDFFDPSVSWWSQVQKIRKEGRLRALTVVGSETWEDAPYQVVELVSVSETFYTDAQLKAFPDGVALKKDRFYIGADSLVHRLVESGPSGRTFDFQFHHLKIGAALTPADFAYAPPAGSKPAAPPPPLLAVGLTAPAFAADSTEGTPINLADYRGKIVVLDFWATWCQPCQKALPHMRKVYDAVQGKDVVFLGLCTWDDRKTYDAWLLKNNEKYPFVFAFDPSGRDSANSIAIKLYSVNGIPATYILDRDGKISARFDDYTEGDTRLETALRKLHIDVPNQKE